MFLFYTNQIADSEATFSPDESRHLVQVLRRKLGDEVDWMDGQGNFYRGKIIDAHRNKCRVAILEQYPDPNLPAWSLHLAVAPTKQIDRIEWMLEKATEIGISSFTPLLCANSERKKIRIDRLEKITLSASKQSLRAKIPVVHPLTKFTDFMEQTSAGQSTKLIAHCADGKKDDLASNYQKGTNVIILIGPEGDFRTNEIELAIENGWLPTALGDSRLRTETAGVYATTVLNFLNQ